MRYIIGPIHDKVLNTVLLTYIVKYIRDIEISRGFHKLGYHERRKIYFNYELGKDNFKHRRRNMCFK